MTRLFDRLIRDPNFPDRDREILRGSVVVHATNVRRMIESKNSAGEVPLLSDVPCIKLPFPKMFVEYSVKLNKQNHSIGVLLRVVESGSAMFKAVSEKYHEEPAEIVNAAAFFNDLHFVDVFIATDETGRLMGLIDGGDVLAQYKIDIDDPANDVVNDTTMVAFYAVGLMHVKNIDIEDIEPTARQNKKHQKRYGEPLTTYKTLKIRPFGGGSRDGDGHHMSPSMHIVRGHFKTFTNDAPLFGRHTGTYWWSHQIRGKAERGAVHKDYEVDS